ncbi:MAG: cadherin-like beta sandwich domain-containing protein [Lachnospiraceae bacterium]|nr:cadherin-like beta sandwich domain-containing protein [Lachnospiraceae bacterium]
MMKSIRTRKTVVCSFQKRSGRNRCAALLLVMLLLLCGSFASADSLSADNSLASLGITTEGAVVSPDFEYGTTEYNVTVPAGTTYLSLDPTPSNDAAYIDSISGQELSGEGGTVSIVVVAENGDAYTYYLYVTVEASAETEPETEVQTEAPQTETEAETEDSRYVSVAKETLEEAENTIDALKSEVTSYRDRVDLLTKILYGMIGLCVVLLFAVINLILKRRDLRKDLDTYQGLSGAGGTGNRDSGEEEKRSGKEEKKNKKNKKNKKTQKAVVVEENTKEAASQRGQEPFAQEPFVQEPFEQTGRDTFYEEEKPAKPKMTDDPTTVPKPSKAKKQPKQMPQYEQPSAVRYEKSKTAGSAQQTADGAGDSGDIDIDFIDL